MATRVRGSQFPCCGCAFGWNVVAFLLALGCIIYWSVLDGSKPKPDDLVAGGIGEFVVAFIGLVAVALLPCLRNSGLPLIIVSLIVVSVGMLYIMWAAHTLRG